MRILAFGDTHGMTDLQHLFPLADAADLVLCAGDITWFSHGLQESLEALQNLSIRSGKKIILVHGNHECEDMRKSLADDQHIQYLHVDHIEAGGVIIIGYGGGGFANHDHAFEKFMSDLQPRLAEKPQIWLLHGPPFDVGIDEIPGWGPTGCRSRRRMIEVFRPKLVVAGHIHQNHGMISGIGSTTIINPGPEGILIDL